MLIKGFGAMDGETDLYRKDASIEAVLSPMPQENKERDSADNGNLQQEAVCTNVCGTDISEKHCLSIEGPGLTNGPLKSQIVRCVKCGSSNVHLGHATVRGTPVCCQECGHFEPSKRNEE